MKEKRKRKKQFVYTTAIPLEGNGEIARSNKKFKNKNYENNNNKIQRKS